MHGSVGIKFDIAIDTQLLILQKVLLVPFGGEGLDNSSLQKEILFLTQHKKMASSR